MATNTPEVRKRWYENNKEQQKANVKRRRIEIREWFRELKSTLKCERCGENHPATLDFHHRDPATKEIGLWELQRKSWGKDRILAEIAKCEVLCANCHRKHHSSLDSSEDRATVS